MKLAKSASQTFEYELMMERLEKEKEEQRAIALMWIIILIVLSAGITLAILYNNYKQRTRLQAEKVKLFDTNRLLAEEKLKTQEQEKQMLDLKLEYKKKDMADMALSLSQKQEWARELNHHIQNIESTKGSKRSREFRKLKDEVNGQVYVDEQIDLLRQNIDILSAEYYTKLREKFRQEFTTQPDEQALISPQDQWLKKIMDILNQHIDCIDVPK